MKVTYNITFRVGEVTFQTNTLLNTAYFQTRLCVLVIHYCLKWQFNQKKLYQIYIRYENQSNIKVTLLYVK